jgi:hypothetical protein
VENEVLESSQGGFELVGGCFCGVAGRSEGSQIERWIFLAETLQRVHARTRLGQPLAEVVQLLPQDFLFLLALPKLRVGRGHKGIMQCAVCTHNRQDTYADSDFSDHGSRAVAVARRQPNVGTVGYGGPVVPLAGSSASVDTRMRWPRFNQRTPQEKTAQPPP